MVTSILDAELPLIFQYNEWRYDACSTLWLGPATKVPSLLEGENTSIIVELKEELLQYFDTFSSEYHIV